MGWLWLVRLDMGDLEGEGQLRRRSLGQLEFVFYISSLIVAEGFSIFQEGSIDPLVPFFDPPPWYYEQVLRHFHFFLLATGHLIRYNPKRCAS